MIPQAQAFHALPADEHLGANLSFGVLADVAEVDASYLHRKPAIKVVLIASHQRHRADDSIAAGHQIQMTVGARGSRQAGRKRVHFAGRRHRRRCGRRPRAAQIQQPPHPMFAKSRVGR